MSDMESPAARRARLFSELCELSEAERRGALAGLAAEDAGLAADVGRMLALDRESRGPIEGLRGEVASAAERQLLADEIPEPAPPERLGAWRLGEKLGAGGMGEVWAAERVEGGFTQRAAVKLVRSGMASREVVARFAVERQLLARLDHPAIARLLDGGIAPDGRPWFAMERVDGLSITHFADSHRLDLEARLRLLLAVAEAVDFAHRSLVIHRDLKPSNILVTPSGAPKLLDFGLAKLLEPGFEAGIDPNVTRTEFRALTPAYAAPEQILGEPVTTATDVYSLGVILYELLTGELPHRRHVRSVATLAAEVARETLELPSTRLRRLESKKAHRALRIRSIAPDLDTIVAKALARSRERRYPSVAALSADLVAYLERRPIAARPDTVRYRLSKFVGRHRWGAASAALMAISLVAGLGVALVQAERARVAATRAAAETKRAEAETERARREGERATRMKDFLLSVFREASPDQRSRGEPLSIGELLDAAEARIDTELAADPLLQADLWDDLAETRASAGELERASTLIEKAIATKRAHLDADDLSIVESLTNRGSIWNLQAEPERGLAAFDEAMAILERRGESGSEPATTVAYNRVYALLKLERNDEAALAIETAHALILRWRPGSPDAAMQRVNAGIVAQRRGRYPEARDHFERAVVELEAVVGPDHALVRTPLAWLGLLYADHLGDPARAVSYLERCVAISRLRYPKDAATITKIETDLARARAKLAGSPQNADRR